MFFAAHVSSRAAQSATPPSYCTVTVRIKLTVTSIRKHPAARGFPNHPKALGARG